MKMIRLLFCMILIVFLVSCTPPETSSFVPVSEVTSSVTAEEPLHMTKETLILHISTALISSA